MVRLEVIEFFDSSNRAIVARYPAQGSADIQYGAQLIVQQNQEAVFFRDGRAMDVFGPGRHTLVTENLPLITRILTAPWQKSPFRALVYFVGKQTFNEQKWGTREPITFRDSELGIVRLRGFGRYAFRVSDSALLINTLVGTQGKYTTSDLSDYLRDVIVTRLTDLLGSMSLSLFDLPAKFDELSAAARIKISDEFQKYGLELVDFFISSITPPEEVQQAIDARSSMKTIGDLNGYTMYQTANSMRKLAEQSGSAAQAAGMGMGILLPGYLQRALEGTPAADPARQVQELRRTPVDPRELVRKVAASAGWRLEEDKSRWTLIVPLGPTRRQSVHVRFDQPDIEGHHLVSFSSACGPAREENAMALLRMNSRMPHVAFAIDSTPAGEMIVVQANQLAETADPLEIARSVISLAWHADQAEQQLIGTDQY